MGNWFARLPESHARTSINRGLSQTTTMDWQAVTTHTFRIVVSLEHPPAWRTGRSNSPSTAVVGEGISPSADCAWRPSITPFISVARVLGAFGGATRRARDQPWSTPFQNVRSAELSLPARRQSQARQMRAMMAAQGISGTTTTVQGRVRRGCGGSRVVDCVRGCRLFRHKHAMRHLKERSNTEKPRLRFCHTVPVQCPYSARTLPVREKNRVS